MADYVDLIKFIKKKYNAEDRAVIAFGGSYGGMLAAWLRMKYPATFQGALAASAPILHFMGQPDDPIHKYEDIISRDFNETYSDHRCGLGIKEALSVLVDIRDKRPGDFAELSTVLNTCKPITQSSHIDDLLEHYWNGLGYMCMTDYPYPSSFLNPMPGWPVNKTCEFFKDIAP